MPGRWIALAALLAGCESPIDGPDTDGDQPRARQPVTVELICGTGNPDAPCAFRPDQVRVQVGDTVRWVNGDATFHTVTSSDSFDVRSPNRVFDAVLDSAGEEFTHTFTAAGTYPYYCQPHSEFMAGTVTVVAG